VIIQVSGHPTYHFVVIKYSRHNYKIRESLAKNKVLLIECCYKVILELKVKKLQLQRVFEPLYRGETGITQLVKQV
jgi:hypothetical protein